MGSTDAGIRSEGTGTNSGPVPWQTAPQSGVGNPHRVAARLIVEFPPTRLLVNLVLVDLLIGEFGESIPGR
jgi:hypothetical protein